MKLVFLSIISSIVIHFLYLINTLVVGYIQTKKYKPDIASNYENIFVLQNEVAFGMIISPLFLMFTFVGVALMSGVIIFLYKGLFR